MLSAQMNEQEATRSRAAGASRGGRPRRRLEPEAPKGSAARKWIVLLVIVAVVGAAVWKIRSNAKEQDNVQLIMAAQAERPTPVQVSAVQQKTMPIFLTALGTVTAYNTVTIKSRVDGQLMQVPVREGQAVQQGQVLAEIDPKPYQAALEQAQGQLVKDQANAVNARAEAARYQRVAAGGRGVEGEPAVAGFDGGAGGGFDRGGSGGDSGGEGESWVHEDSFADQWRGGAAAGRSGKYSSCFGHKRLAGGDAVAADRGDLYAAGGSVAGGAEEDARR